MTLWFEDLQPGRVFHLGPYEVTEEEIIEFASDFDPQDFHVDPNSDQAARIGGLIASGWHTCSMTMRMMCDSYLLDSSSQGAPSVEVVKWLRPVRPGNVLRGTSTVESVRTSASRPRLGFAFFRHQVANENGEPVLEMTNTGMFRRRKSEG